MVLDNTHYRLTQDINCSNVQLKIHFLGKITLTLIIFSKSVQNNRTLYHFVGYFTNNLLRNTMVCIIISTFYHVIIYEASITTVIIIHFSFIHYIYMHFWR